MSDYLTADPGSTEELIYERRAMEHFTEAEKEQFKKDLDEVLKESERVSLTEDFEDNTIAKLKPSKPKKGEEFSHLFMDDDKYADFYGGEEFEPNETNFEPNRMAHGDWTEMVVDVRRGVHLWCGGRLETFRAMVVGGNLNGCGGFGVGRHPEALKAVQLAAKKCRRNIFFVDRYQGNGLTRDLVGTQNSTKCVIRATDNGLRGNPLMKEILLRIGISNGSCKAYGNRHNWNVVRATFKALCTHESIEQMALKRGKRILSIDRALRMQV
jgi:small subunit ribosomal protein S5